MPDTFIVHASACQELFKIHQACLHTAGCSSTNPNDTANKPWPHARRGLLKLPVPSIAGGMLTLEAM